MVIYIPFRKTDPNGGPWELVNVAQNWIANKALKDMLRPGSSPKVIDPDYEQLCYVICPEADDDSKPLQIANVREPVVVLGHGSRHNLTISNSQVAGFRLDPAELCHRLIVGGLNRAHQTLILYSCGGGGAGTSGVASFISLVMCVVYTQLEVWYFTEDVHGFGPIRGGSMEDADYYANIGGNIALAKDVCVKIRPGEARI